MNNKISLIVLTMIVVLAGAIRFFKLDEIPPGLYWDEVSIGYNAYSILRTGKDEHGQFLPQLFKAYGEFKLPVYIYATVGSITLFGKSDFAIRFTSALAGTLSVLLIYLFTAELIPKQKNGMLPLLSALMLAINPWHIHLSHAGFETNLMLFFLLSASVAFMQGKRGRKHALPLAIVLFFLAFNTYNSARVFVPLILLAFIVIYRKDISPYKREFVHSIVVGVIGLLLMIPQFVSGDALIRARSESIFEKEPTVTLFLENYLANFDTTFLFFRGDQNGRHSVRKLGMFHAFELPLILIGLQYLLKRKDVKKANAIIFSWLLLGPIPSALTTINPHALRSLNILPAWVLLLSLGAWRTLVLIQKQKYSLKLLLIPCVVFVCSFSVLLHLHQYLIHYPNETALDWQDGLKETVEIIKNRYDQYERIYISDYLSPVYVGYYFPIDPKYYQSIEPTKEIGKLNYFKNSWDINIDKNQKVLIVAPQSQKPKQEIHFEEVKMFNGDVIFNIWEE